MACVHAFKTFKSQSTLLQSFFGICQQLFKAVAGTVFFINSGPVVIIRLISGYLKILEGLESSLIELLLGAVRQWLDDTNMLANLSESDQTLKDVIHGNTVVDLIIELLQLVCEAGASAFKVWTRIAHIVQVDLTRQRISPAMLNCRWLVIRSYDLVHKRDLSAQERKLLNTRHFQMDGLIIVSYHVLQCHIDRHEKTHSSVLL